MSSHLSEVQLLSSTKADHFPAYARWRIIFPSHNFVGARPSWIPVKGTASRWAKREQGQYVTQNAFLTRLQKGEPGTRPTSPARCATYWSSYIDFLECSCDVVLLASVIRPRHLWSHYLCASYGTNVEILRFTRDSKGNSIRYFLLRYYTLAAVFWIQQSSIDEASYMKIIFEIYYLIILKKFDFVLRNKLRNLRQKLCTATWKNISNLKIIEKYIYISADVQ